MSERGNRILELKGYTEDEAEPPISPEQLAKLLRDREERPLIIAAEYDNVELYWNPDGTLDRIVSFKDGEVLYDLHFAWNADGSLSRVMRG